jgi:hypothetical protein
VSCGYGWKRGTDCQLRVETSSTQEIFSCSILILSNSKSKNYCLYLLRSKYEVFVVYRTLPPRLVTSSSRYLGYLLWFSRYVFCLCGKLRNLTPEILWRNTGLVPHNICNTTPFVSGWHSLDSNSGWPVTS